MPAPSKTSVDAIVDAGRRLLETDGLDGLTLQSVAQAVGVRAPSLYKRIAGRGDLVRRIGNAVALDLGAAIQAASASGEPKTDLRAMAHAVRDFARRQPRGYALLSAPLPDEWRIDADLNDQVGAIITRKAADITGAAYALHAARTVVAWLNGFVAMEQAGAFRMGGDIDQAFDFGIDAILAGLERQSG